MHYWCLTHSNKAMHVGSKKTPLTTNCVLFGTYLRVHVHPLPILMIIWSPEWTWRKIWNSTLTYVCMIIKASIWSDKKFCCSPSPSADWWPLPDFMTSGRGEISRVFFSVFLFPRIDVDTSHQEKRTAYCRCLKTSDQAVERIKLLSIKCSTT